MAEIEELEIIIDVAESFEEELDDLIMKLAEVEGTVQAVDDINLDVDVRGQSQLDRLMTQMLQLQAMDLAGVGNVDVGTRGGFGGGAAGGLGGGMGLAAMEVQTEMLMDAFSALDDSISGLDGNMARSMGNMMSSADRAADEFDITNISMSKLHNAVARVVPLLVVFVGALPAAITGVVALGAAAVSAAAALAAITGFGALGAAMARGDGNIGEGFQDILSDVRESFLDAFAPLARRLEPVFEDMVDGLGALFQEISNLSNILFDVVDDARAFGSFISDFAVGTIAAMGRMADAFGPLFAQIGAFVEEMDVLRDLTNFLANILPELRVATLASLSLLAALTEMSKGFLLVAAGVLATLDVLFTFIDIVPFVSNEMLGTLAASALIVFSALVLLRSELLRNAAVMVGSYAKSIILTISNLAGLAAAELGATGAAYLLTTAILTLIGVLTLGIGTIATASFTTAMLGKSFRMLSGDIGSATSSLREFQNVQSGMDSTFSSPDVQRGSVGGGSRFGGRNININVEGDADTETIRNQSQNAMYRMERTTSGGN